MSNTKLGSGEHLRSGGSERCWNRCDRGAGSARPDWRVYHGRQTTGLLVNAELVVQSRGVCMCTGDAGGEGLT